MRLLLANACVVVVCMMDRALILDKLGRYAEALEDFSAAIRGDPNSAVAYHNRGYCYRNMGQYGEAIQDYTMAIRLDNQYVAAYNNRG